MIIFSLDIQALEHKHEIGNKAYNLALVADLLGRDSIVNGFVIAAKSLQNCKIEKIASEISIECFRRNINFPIILRSSANVEDSQNSFAGIFDSYVCENVDDIYRGLEVVLLAKKSERLQLYCDKIHINSSCVYLSVIVQMVIKAEYGGVAFSKNPITNDDSVIYIEYLKNNVSGVEEGTQNPVVVFINKNGYGLNLKESKMFGILRECILRLEMYFEKAIDVEWAYSKEKLQILQVRPITT